MQAVQHCQLLARTCQPLQLATMDNAAKLRMYISWSLAQTVGAQRSSLRLPELNNVLVCLATVMAALAAAHLSTGGLWGHCT